MKQHNPANLPAAGTLDPVSAAITFQIAVYLILSFRLVLAHSARIKENFSSVERIGLSWLRDLIVACSVLWVLYAFMNLFSPALGVLKETNYLISLMIAVVIFVMGYKGIRQPVVFFPSNSGASAVPIETSMDEAGEQVGQTNADEPRVTGCAEPCPDSGKKYRKSSLSAGLSESIHERLLQTMALEKPFVDEDLTLHSLAEQLGVSPNHLSQVINGRLNRSFFDLVNEYRVREAIRLLAAPESARLSILGIALDSGFKSKSAFYTAFRKHTGVTPTRYKERLLSDSPPSPN
jgi:AraC-like DNA-binding protein